MMVVEPIEVHQLEFAKPPMDALDEHLLEHQLNKTHGVIGAFVLPKSNEVLIRFDPHLTTGEQILRRVEHIGYRPQRAKHSVEWNLPY